MAEKETEKEIQLVTLDQVVNWKLDLVLDKLEELMKKAEEQ